MKDKYPVLLKTTAGVNVSDYYTDALLEFLLPWLHDQKLPSSVLEIGTGRGYLSIVLAKEFPLIKSIVATDIEKTAIMLAKHNVKLNKLQDVIKIKMGSLFTPAKKNKFDLIVSVPPQLPLTRHYIKQLIPKIDSYHLTTSVGGRTGRQLVNKIINQSGSHLNPGGILCLVHSDIINLDDSVSKLQSLGYRAFILGKKTKLLSETTLTQISKEVIETTGYIFSKDKKNCEFFTVGVVLGIYDQLHHKKHRTG